jgi:hypothetical protein
MLQLEIMRPANQQAQQHVLQPNDLQVDAQFKPQQAAAAASRLQRLILLPVRMPYEALV